MMVAQKRALSDSFSSHKVKKSRTDKIQPPSTSLPDEVDFPRGGGSSFTPLEVKTIRAEAVKEANEELFHDKKQQGKKRKRNSEAEKKATQDVVGREITRVEHLNYKRLKVGMKIFGKIIAILPLTLLVSLPNQLFAHVPITNISSQLTELLECDNTEEVQSDIEEGGDEATLPSRPRLPELSEIFSVGQYVRAVVSAIHAQGATDISGIGRSRDDMSKSSKRVELCLIPERVNVGVQNADLKPGFTLTAAIRTREDHGYVLDLGIADVSGFLPFDNLDAGRNLDRPPYIGELLEVTVTKLSANGRICTLTSDPGLFSSFCSAKISSVSSVLPGTLVQALVTGVHASGLNLQVLGFFDGTIDLLHLNEDIKKYQTGKRVKARVLYDYSASPPKFALALSDHVLNLASRCVPGKRGSETGYTIQEAYPVGTVLEGVKVLRVETERGLIVEIEPGIEGFVHISHTSDDHVPSLSSSGHWKVNSIHPARVTGYFALDGLLQLSMKPSIIQQKYFQVSDVEVGEVVKGTIKKLTDSGLFISLSGGVDGVIWPNHYADIPLKHPAKRFKEGVSIKCRVLVVDADRKRICLTAKKTLVESNLAVISRLEDVATGKVAHGVVFKVFEKHILVEFYNNIKAIVPAKELSDSPVIHISQSFPVGKVVRVRILAVEDGRITASIKQSTSAHDIADISAIEIGHMVEGTIAEIHKDNILLTLLPSHARALLSLKNLANHRGLSLTQLRTGLKLDDKLDELVVVSRNLEKALVIVANKPKAKPTLLTKGSAATMDSLTVGQLVGGRITRHTHRGALVKITSHIGGILHYTDIADNFEAGNILPAIDSIIKAVVIGIDYSKRQLSLSMRSSRMKSEERHEIVDREIGAIADVHVGETVRGFVKNIGEHGLFVTIGRELDARVQIRELFDEYIKDWKGRFQVNQVVKGRILSVDVENKKIELSLKSGDPSARPGPSRVSLSDLKEGQKVDGQVKKTEEYGVFIQIENSKLNGLCHKSELSDNVDADVSAALRNFRAGDRVKAFILSVEGNRISLSLKPSYFTEDDLDETGDTDDELNAAAPQLSGPTIDGDSDQDAEVDAPDHENDYFSADKDQFNHKPSGKQATTSLKTRPVPLLALSGGFQWSDAPQIQEGYASSSDEEESAEPVKKRRKKKEIEEDLTAHMHTKRPESNADFERLLLGSPNSSYLWIQYMSFQLPLSEVDKAREIARRALRLINFREEQEKMNVWIALLNLENVYGSDDSMETTFKEAARANDSKTIYLKLAAIFDQSDKVERAEEQYQRTCKKFGQSSKVWSLFAEFLLRRGSQEEARKLLPRCLQTLEKRKHLKTISRFAQLEYKYAEPERGKTLFEGIVDSHPKRWDMWSIYMDMEAGQKNIQSLRNLFDRLLVLKMTSHKAKSFFKKWLEIEKRIGDEGGVETVKQKAVEWTQRASNGS